MTHIQVVSELSKAEDAQFPNIPKKADILALVGNIFNIDNDKYEEFLADLSSRFSTVFIVPGNKDYYSQALTIEELNEKVDSICKKHSNLIFLNNKTAVVQNTKFIGSTLWPTIPKEHANAIQSTLEDFSNILIDKTKKNVITPRDCNKLHKDDVAFVSNEVMSAKSTTNQRVVVLSHYPPSPTGTFDATGLPASIKCTCYTDMEHVLGPPVDLWIFGHTNKTCTIDTSFGTKLVSNPFTATGFSFDKTVALPSPAAPSDKKPNYNKRYKENPEESDDAQTDRLMNFLMAKNKDNDEEKGSKRKYFNTSTTTKQETKEQKKEDLEYSEEDELESFLKDSTDSPTTTPEPKTTPPPAKKQKEFKF